MENPIKMDDLGVPIPFFFGAFFFPRRYYLSQGFRVVAVEANRKAIEVRVVLGSCILAGSGF